MALRGLHHEPLSSVFAEGDTAIEAGDAACVATTTGSCHFSLEPKRVLIAVGADLNDAKGVSARLALAPEFPARARPKMSLTSVYRPGKGLFVHIGEHQDFAGFCRRHDSWQQTVRIEGRCEGISFLQCRLVVDRWELLRVCHRNGFLLRLSRSLISVRDRPPAA